MLKKIFAKRVEKKCVDMHVRYQNSVAYIDIGELSFFISCEGYDLSQNENVDFAVYGALAIAKSINLDVTIDQPVSEKTVRNIKKIQNAWACWDVEGVYPTQFTFNNIVYGPGQTKRSKNHLFCLSGGLDSIHAVLQSTSNFSPSHSLLIQGADYNWRDSVGFSELTTLVSTLSSELNMKTVIIKTNIRDLPFNWDYLHSLNLGMCLHALSPWFAMGGFAADNTDYQDYARHPWGNNRFLGENMGTDFFPIHYVGFNENRTEKTRIFNERRALLPYLSVCYADKTIGGNCGRCEKCIMTKLNFLGGTGKVPDIFKSNHDLLESVKAIKPPKKAAVALGSVIRYGEILPYLPDGDIKDQVTQLVRKSRKKAKKSFK